MFSLFFFLMVFCSTAKKTQQNNDPFSLKLFQYLGKGFNSTSCRIHCRFVFEQEYIPLSQVY